jgi:energy-coupling factor transporter ATP-binding protein EcfA2
MSPACDFSVINHNINTKFIVELKFLNEGQRAVPQPFNSHRFVNITSVADVWDMPLHWDASVEANNYPSLFSLQTWDCIPSFAIVTGKNGEGKSQLLRYIRDLEGKDNGRVYFQSPTVSFVDDGRPQFRTLPLFEDNNYWDSFYNALFRMVRNLSVKKNPILNSFFFRYVVEYSRTARLEGFSIEVLRQIGALQLKKLVNDLKLRSADKLWSVIVSSFSEKKRSCLPPWDLFNKALTEVGFGYHIEVTNSSWILKSNQGSGIAFNQLSTGQQIIFSVLSILHFPVQLDDYERDPLKLMLLDEPDKHLDPENCKKFLDVLIRLSNEHSIQVIMTTHRIDLISLAPPDSLFSLGNRQISPCSHLLSYLRMTKNARELTPFTVKVYVEAPTDARFYVSIYNILRMYSDRERKQNSSQLFWSKTGWISRVLSNRFPLEILSAAIGDGGSGGKVAVKGTLAREFHAVNSQQHLGRTRSILSSPNLKFPFGIIDKDYFNTKAQSGLSKSEEWNILILERYAIENYLLDPYLVCSVLIPSEIDQIHDPVIRNALLRNGDFAEYFNHLIYLWFRKVFFLLIHY